MRLHRLRIENFRGTVAREVTLEGGVTVVEGPNEVGKSSLAEALHLLLDGRYKHDSRSRDVERVRPIDRDAIPGVEAEIEAGAYRFIYRKRFTSKKGGGTELEVLAPRPAQSTGDAAMQRVDEILGENLDLDLFRALQVEQGRTVEQATLGDKAWLSQALDEASGGGSGDDDRHETLFEKVKSRYLEFYTAKTGSPTKTLAGPRSACQETQQRRDGLLEKLQHLNAAVEDHARLTHELTELNDQLPRIEKSAKDRRAEVGRLEGVEREVTALDQRAKAAAARAEMLDTQFSARERRASDLADAHALLEPKQDQLRAAVAGIERASAEHDSAERLLREATRSAASHACASAEARSDLDRLGRLEVLAELRQRRQRVEDHHARLKALQKRVRASISENVLRKLEALTDASKGTRAALQTAAGLLVVEALSDLDVLVDGAERHLTRGEQVEPEPGAPIDITLPERLRIQLRAGAGTSDLRAAAESAEQELADALRAAGVQDLAAARTRAEDARSARYEHDAVQRLLEELAQGLDVSEGVSVLDALDTRIADHDSEVERLDSGRPVARPVPRNSSHAREILDTSVAGEAKAIRVERDAQRASAEASKQLAEEEKLHATLAASVAEVARQVTDLTERLRAERETRTDDALRAELDQARTERDMLRDQYGRLCRQLENAGLEEKRALADNDDQVVDGQRRRRQQLLDDLRDCAAVLRHGEGLGLGEQVQEVEATLAQLQLAQEQVERRACAAKLLFETMSTHRADAKSARVRPLTERVRKLGRVVFGETFTVELDDDLEIASRTLGGLTVLFDDLSVGAREQLDLLLRIAVAQVVANRGGVPLILDDTLGNTDPERLAAMNALLGIAGREIQVVVLTCHPERFARVGGATFVRLTPAS